MRDNIMQSLDFDDVTIALQSQELTAAEFKDVMKQVYDQPEGHKNLFDMATGVQLPHGAVVASYIFQWRWRRSLSTFTTFTDINDTRNGLLLYKPVDWAFGRGVLCVEISGGCMSFRLLDPTLKNVKLTDMASNLRNQCKHPNNCDEVDLPTTFGDLDGRKVFFPPNSTMRPSQRLLALHAYTSWLHTSRRLNSNIAPPTYDVSEDEDTKTRIKVVVDLWRSGVASE
jgi:hypothetical protein